MSAVTTTTSPVEPDSGALSTTCPSSCWRLGTGLNPRVALPPQVAAPGYSPRRKIATTAGPALSLGVDCAFALRLARSLNARPHTVMQV